MSDRRMRFGFTVWMIILVSGVSFVQPLPAQTKLWEFSGLGKQVRPAGDGGSYVTRSVNTDVYGVWSGPDTLYKLDATGALEWSYRLDADRSRLYPTAAGLYVIASIGVETVYYFNTEGTVLWQYAYSIPHISATSQVRNGTPLIDPAGNLVYPAVIQTINETGLTGLSGSLVKLDQTGAVLFEVDLPAVAAGPQLDGTNLLPEYQGPFVDRTGNIWMVLSTVVDRYTVNGMGVTSDVATGTIEVMLYNGITGSQVFRKTVLEARVANDKYYPDGRGHSTNTHFPFVEDYVVGTDRLVGYGTDGLFTNRVSPRGTRSKGQNFWSVVSVDNTGKYSWFKFKGNGKELWSDGGDQDISDGASNYLEHAWVGSDNSIYIDGEISRGKSRNGVGVLHYDHVLLKIGTTNRISWKKKYPDGARTYSNRFFYHRGEDKMMLVSDDGMHITEIDSRGAEGLQPFDFSTAMYAFTGLYDESMEQSNVEPGYLYGRTADAGSGDWAGVVKYSLPPAVFGPPPAASEPGGEDILVEAPVIPARNYPNPFNPSTTVAFELNEEASVDIVVYNILGMEVDVLAAQEIFPSGLNEVEFDGSALATGVYIYRISAIGLESGQPVLVTSGRMLLAK